MVHRNRPGFLTALTASFTEWRQQAVRAVSTKPATASQFPNRPVSDVAQSCDIIAHGPPRHTTLSTRLLGTTQNAASTPTIESTACQLPGDFHVQRGMMVASIVVGELKD